MSQHARLSAQDRRASLIEAGKHLFAQESYDQISAAELADRAGVSNGLVYHYFGSKRGWYIATLEAVAAEVLAAADLDASLPLPSGLERAIAGFVDYIDTHDRLYIALMRGGVGTDAESLGLIESVRRTLLDRIVAALALDAPTPALRARLYGWLGFAEFTTMDWLDHRDLSRDEVIQLIYDAFFATVPGLDQGAL